jgi:hypothetical protein
VGSDLVAECYVAPREIREDRLLIRIRINLVQDRTRVMNRVRSLLDKYHVRCDYDKIFGVKGIRWLSRWRPLVECILPDSSMKKRFILGKNDPVNDIYDAYENTESNSDT